MRWMPRRRRGRRGRGTTYYDRTMGSWVAVVSVGTRDGKRIRRKARARDEDDAQVQLARLLRATDAGVDPAKGTLDHYLAGWLEDVRANVRESTWTSYSGHVRLHISPLLGGIPLVRLRPSDVRRLKSALLGETIRRDNGTEYRLSPTTVGRVLVTLRIALNAAVRERLLPDNPADAVPLPRVERRPVRAMDTLTAEAIIDACKGSIVDNLVVLLLGSGLRAGEALGLDWGDVGDGFVVVRRSKTTVRAVPISDDAMAALDAQKAATPRWGAAVPVFLGQRTGERMRVDTALQAFQRCLERAGLPPMRLHDLRHGVASMLVAQGVHMRVVAEQLGHANPAITAKTYAHILPESQREAVRLLDRKHAETG